MNHEFQNILIIFKHKKVKEFCKSYQNNYSKIIYFCHVSINKFLLLQKFINTLLLIMNMIISHILN